MEINTSPNFVIKNERIIKGGNATPSDNLQQITFKGMTETQKEIIENSNICAIGNYARDVYSSKEDVPKEYITCTHKSSDSKFYTFDVSVVSPGGNKTDIIKIDRGFDTLARVQANEQTLTVPRQCMKSPFPKEFVTIDMEDIINGRK